MTVTQNLKECLVATAQALETGDTDRIDRNLSHALLLAHELCEVEQREIRESEEIEQDARDWVRGIWNRQINSN